VAYSNRNTRGSDIRGYQAISPKLGERIWNQILLHDDGTLGFGGTRTLSVGGQGSGKTTLNTKFARKSFYIDGVNKHDFEKSFDEEHPDEWINTYAKNLHPETVLWRGRIFDSWNVLIPHIYHRCYPEETFIKPLRVHVHRGDNLNFFEENVTTGKFHPIKYLDISYYSGIKELYNDILEGGNNIIYPPEKHFLSTQLKEAINIRRSLSRDDHDYLHPEKEYLAERDIFIFDVIKHIFDISLENNKRKWYTVIIDESHDVLKSNAPDIYYWIIDWFVDIIIDTRRWNLSLVCQAHGTTLIDWRILERFSHFIWLRGSRPPQSYSQVDGRVIRHLKMGNGIIESVSDGIIGRFEYDRIPHNVSRLVVLNTNQSQQTLNNEGVDNERVAVSEGSEG
jgi:hypothetical protein